MIQNTAEGVLSGTGQNGLIPTDHSFHFLNDLRGLVQEGKYRLLAPPQNDKEAPHLAKNFGLNLIRFLTSDSNLGISRIGRTEITEELFKFISESADTVTTELPIRSVIEGVPFMVLTMQLGDELSVNVPSTKDEGAGVAAIKNFLDKNSAKLAIYWDVNNQKPFMVDLLGKIGGNLADIRMMITEKKGEISGAARSVYTSDTHYEQSICFVGKDKFIAYGRAKDPTQGRDYADQFYLLAKPLVSGAEYHIYARHKFKPAI